jgi:hypothetical protein
MGFLITIHNSKGITLGNISLDDAPVHIPLVGDQIQYVDENGELKDGTVASRQFKWIAGTQQVILTVSF